MVYKKFNGFAANIFTHTTETTTHTKKRHILTYTHTHTTFICFDTLTGTTFIHQITHTYYKLMISNKILCDPTLFYILKLFPMIPTMIHTLVIFFVITTSVSHNNKNIYGMLMTFENRINSLFNLMKNKTLHAKENYVPIQTADQQIQNNG